MKLFVKKMIGRIPVNLTLKEMRQALFSIGSTYRLLYNNAETKLLIFCSQESRPTFKTIWAFLPEFVKDFLMKFEESISVLDVCIDHAIRNSYTKLLYYTWMFYRASQKICENIHFYLSSTYCVGLYLLYYTYMVCIQYNTDTIFAVSKMNDNFVTF